MSEPDGMRADADTEAGAGAQPARKTALLGVLSVVVAILTGILVWIGIALSLGGDYVAGTSLAYLATGTSVVAIIFGASAMLLGRGRFWGVVGIVVGILLTPLLLTRLLAWVSGLG
jgi:hypothetical protein